MMLKEGERNEKVSIQRQPDSGNIEASRVWCACCRSVSRTWHEQRPAVKRIAVSQSNYIPWKGYFDMIADVDEFVLYDDAQFTRRDWRNRNKIKTPQGLQWLSVPVKVKGKYTQTIKDTALDGNRWSASHWTAITLNYRRAPFFDEIATWLEPLYLEEVYTDISTLNRRFIESICNYMGISTRLTSSSDYELLDGKSERLAGICAQTGASVYVSGPAAKDYLDEAHFEHRGISVRWHEYGEYPEYAQLWGDFEHHVSIIDALFNCGSDVSKFLGVKRR